MCVIYLVASGKRWWLPCAKALQDFQERCSVDGVVFASVAAGHGSSGGPLLNSRGAAGQVYERVL